MQRRKTFLRKTRKGKILKTVREHYLRDDIYCGVVDCKECQKAKGGEDQQAKLTAGARCLLVDTNIALHQLDLLEAKGNAFDNVIFLQTVLQEVEHNSRKLYGRLRKLIESKVTWYVFSNEHHRSTYVERLPKESPNDRNDRAIRAAVRWYTKHLEVQPLFLTNDADNKTKALLENLKCETVSDHVKGLVQQDKEQYVHLLDFLAQDAPEGKTELGFTPYLSDSALKKALEDHVVKKGVYGVGRTHWGEATVTQQGKPPIIIPAGHFYSNRAVDGDVVGVQLLPEKDWKIGKDGTEPSPTGRVVGIFQRRWRDYCGSLEETDKTQGSVLFISVVNSIPKIKIESRQIQALMDKRIMVAIDSWPITSPFPLGHFVRTVGVIGDRDTETEVVLIEHDIPTKDWTVAVLKCLPPPDYTIPAEEIARRVDLRDALVCSIDPPGCTDIDDALHCRPLPNGNFEVGVHIADVSHFMRPETALDEEAAHRSTSVYLVQRRIDMIPNLLSTNLASLHEHVERLTFSVVWEMTPQAEVVNRKFFKSVIKSVGAFTYAQAQERIDQGLQDPVSVSMKNLNDLARILKRKRMEAGALNLASNEIKFILDKETQNPEDVQMYQIKEVHSLVEEFMLFANVAVAEKTLEHFPQFAFLRRHPTPKPENFLPLQRAAKTVGFQIDVSSSGKLAESLDRCVKQDNPQLNKLIRCLTTRCMSQAVYFSSGEYETKEFRHYGLASTVYTHFTSPIRRYADVLVHRLLAAALGIDPVPAACADKVKTRETCEVINHRHRMAQFAGRASAELFTLIFFRDKDVEEDAVITDVRNNAVSVFVPKYGTEGRVVLWKENKDEEGPVAPNPYVFDEEKLTLQGEGRLLKIFDKVRVRIYVQTSKFRRPKQATPAPKKRKAKAVAPSPSEGPLKKQTTV